MEPMEELTTVVYQPIVYKVRFNCILLSNKLM